MEQQLKWVLLLPLKEMALRKVAVLLWSGPDVLASISKFRIPEGVITDDDRKDWRETLESKIKDKVSKLGLPESLAKKMIDLVRPIGLVIRRWKHLHERRYLSEKVCLPGSTKLCWTTVGGIDDRRTAEELVRCEEMSVEQRYEIACDYCLEDWIPLLWEELPEERKDYFSEQRPRLSLDLQFLWPHILKGEQANLDYLWIRWNRNLTSFNQWAFEQSAKKGYSWPAVEHFLQKLTHEEREASLMRSALALRRENYFLSRDNKRTCDVMCYLLSLMTPEEQRRFIEAHPISILSIFLYWPLQDLFLENASLLWTFIPPRDYDDLLSKMFRRFKMSENCFPILFRGFFIQSPLAFKKYFVGRRHASNFLRLFIKFEDSESIEVVFRNVDAADRVKLVCRRRILDSFFGFVVRNEWHMLELFLREATLSKVDMKRLEEAFRGFLGQNQLNLEDPVFKRLLKFLNDTYQSADKEKKARKRKLCPEE